MDAHNPKRGPSDVVDAVTRYLSAEPVFFSHACGTHTQAHLHFLVPVIVPVMTVPLFGMQAWTICAL